MSRYLLQQNGTPPIVWSWQNSVLLFGHSKIRLDSCRRFDSKSTPADTIRDLKVKSVPCVGRRIFPEAAEDEFPRIAASMWQMKKPIPTAKRAELCFSATSSFGAEVIFEGFTGSKLSHDTWSGKIKLTETLSRYSWLFFWEQSLVIVQCLSKDGK